MPTTHKTRCYLIVVLVVFILNGACHTYYKATPASTELKRRKTIDSLQKQNRYFILRNGNAAYSINQSNAK